MPDTIDHKSRAHALLSASSSARWLACPASAVASEAYPSQDTAYTREGTLAHEVAEANVRLKLGLPAKELPKGEFPAEMLRCADEYAAFVQEHITDPSATVLLEQRVDFSDWVPDGFGTCDCILIQGSTMTVIDYKYGAGVKVDAGGNTQLMLYALGALNDYGIAYDIEDVEMYIFQPRMDNISVMKDKASTVRHWADTVVKKVAEMAIHGKGGYHPGRHCQFCPHAGRCRSLSAQCREFVETRQGKMKVEVLAPFEIAEVLRMEPMITIWLKAVKERALNSMLSGEAVPGYKVVEGKLGNRKWRDDMEVLSTLREAGYTDAEVTETKLLSPAGMDKALGKKRVESLLSGYIDRSPGAPTIVPETDKRPALDRTAEAIKDFE